MTDSQAKAVPNVSPDALLDNGDKKKSPACKSSTDARARKKTSASTPTKPSSSPKPKPTSNTTRSRSRPAPVRSLSSPLARSLSARLPKKRGRLSDSSTPVSTTYRDDFKSPEELSYKLQGLNLETSFRPLTDNGGERDISTTYRDSYRWRCWGTDNSSSRSLTPHNGEHGTQTSCDVRSKSRVNHLDTLIKAFDTSSPMKKAVPLMSGNRNQKSNVENEPDSPSPWIYSPSEESPKSGSALTYYKTVSHMRDSVNSDKTFLPSTREASSREFVKPANRKTMSLNLASENGVILSSPVNGNTSANGSETQSPGTYQGQAQKLSNESHRSSNAGRPNAEGRSHRSPVHQLQSSNGGSPFAYGSDTVTWV